MNDDGLRQALVSQVSVKSSDLVARAREAGLEVPDKVTAAELIDAVEADFPRLISEDLMARIHPELDSKLAGARMDVSAGRWNGSFTRDHMLEAVIGDYDVDEKHRAASPTLSGVRKVEKALGIDNLYLDVNGNLVNHFIQALKAHALYRKDKEYIVRDGELLIVDEFTGRVLEGRRYSEGLHQALEAKEGLRIREENQTLATITLQNYFRMYEKLSGMTGTASTEANEFQKIYETDVTSIPTNRPMVRIDENDFIFKTKDAKFRAVVEDIVQAHERGQPVLVGTISVEISEMLSGMLTRRGIPHNVLNAKNHAREAEIILGAGQPGAVTIATNMAGRGVDIKLGEGVKEVGGLYILGTERHESRRIDNQLRGRAGRQGDPGRSRFFLSAEDDLIRIFSGDRIYKILDRLGPGDDLPIEAKMLSKTVEGAQKKVEEQNFNIRKRVLDYDDVLNKQREVIYSERRRVLEGEDLGEQARDWIAETLVDVVEQFADDDALPADWDLPALFTALHAYYPMGISLSDLQPDLEHPERPAHPRGAPRQARGRHHGRVRASRGGAGRDARARPRALGAAAAHRPALARAPLQHGLPARGHPPARARPEGPALGVPARGPHDVRRDDDPREGRVRAVHVPHPGRPGARGRGAEGRRRGLLVPERPDPGLRRRGRRRRRRPSSRPRSRPARSPSWSSGSSPTRTRSAATTPARAAPARSTRGATGPRPRSR